MGSLLLSVCGCSVVASVVGGVVGHPNQDTQEKKQKRKTTSLVVLGVCCMFVLFR